MADGTNAAVRHACVDLLAEAAQFYGTPRCGIRVLAARPLRVREHGFAAEGWVVDLVEAWQNHIRQFHIVQARSVGQGVEMWV